MECWILSISYSFFLLLLYCHYCSFNFISFLFYSILSFHFLNRNTSFTPNKTSTLNTFSSYCGFLFEKLSIFIFNRRIIWNVEQVKWSDFFIFWCKNYRKSSIGKTEHQLHRTKLYVCICMCILFRFLGMHFMYNSLMVIYLLLFECIIFFIQISECKCLFFL